MRQQIRCVTIDLTTHCDRRCPECCLGIGINRVLQHHPWEYFVNAAKFLHGIHRVNLTGGEPTSHPQFRNFVPRFKELFGCELLTMSTDCLGLKAHATVIALHIDALDISLYDSRSDDYAVSLDWIHVFRGLTGLPLMPVNIFDARLHLHISRDRRGSGAMCFRGESDTVSYADGKLYGCCVAPGVDGAQGIELTADWRERIAEAPLPCRDCWFSP